MKVLQSFLLHCVVLLLTLNRAMAMIVLTGPDMGDTYTASDGEISIPISWQFDDDSPAQSEIVSYSFLLCTGPNNPIHGLQQLASINSTEITTNGFMAQFDADIAASGSFYVQVFCELQNGGYIIRYTNRVNLKGMTGTYAPSGSGSSPSGEYSSGENAAEAASASSASFSLTYTAQTGKTRYAPMQMQPGSTVTVTTWSRRFPTSAVTFYSTAQPSPVVRSTITPGWSYTMSSFVNYATPAPFPSEVGWYPASARLESASLDSSLGDSGSKAKLRRRWVD